MKWLHLFVRMVPLKNLCYKQRVLIEFLVGEKETGKYSPFMLRMEIMQLIRAQRVIVSESGEMDMHALLCPGRSAIATSPDTINCTDAIILYE